MKRQKEMSPYSNYYDYHDGTKTAPIMHNTVTAFPISSKLLWLEIDIFTGHRRHFEKDPFYSNYLCYLFTW